MSDGSISFPLEQVTETWVFRFIVNILGYMSILVPGYFLIRWLEKSPYLQGGRISRSNGSCLQKTVRACVVGHETHGFTDLNSDPTSEQETQSIWRRGGILLFCFVGLQVSYLTWGVLQEKMMTKDYYGDNPDVHSKFKDSQFLVFVNRIWALILSGLCILAIPQPRHYAPIYKYSYCALSNILSSWCQYEALKFVSFPTQVLAKASKVIPVMIMGKIVSRKTYEFYEYFTAILISVGMTFFLLTNPENKDIDTRTTTFSGCIILVGYLVFDSFTSNWQGELFTRYRMSSLQMMCGVNIFSTTLTLVSLLQQGSFFESLRFMFTFPAFFIDCVLLSMCSAIGQLFIYYTIHQFGAVVFIIIMTIRQAIAILLSVIIYQHPLSVEAFLGIILVFVAVFLRVYCSQRMKQLRAKQKLLKKEPPKT
ncbi:unnamed protein product [Darwinula stevensoni]|uniref:Adenosine 3'-phospho 5'-phosphosulfate transporter 1 n=1 Tax=Darwinula stevensoni TaxID=69355 RepID=A0A7R9A540_9CRUS|nr:unnamed protein product [Darwinula stevensoni]CAG0885626.1 unnamed protein product [Darwinula stevensoni]